MTKYLSPYTEVERDITNRDPNSTISVCSCGKNHTWISRPYVVHGIPDWICKTPVSWSGQIIDLLSGKVEPVKINMTPAEVNLVDTIRKMYEKPPDKNIIAALMMTQWIRAQRMPFESDRLIEPYDAPKKKGIV